MPRHRGYKAPRPPPTKETIQYAVLAGAWVSLNQPITPNQPPNRLLFPHPFPGGTRNSTCHPWHSTSRAYRYTEGVVGRVDNETETQKSPRRQTVVMEEALGADQWVRPPPPRPPQACTPWTSGRFCTPETVGRQRRRAPSHSGASHAPLDWKGMDGAMLYPWSPGKDPEKEATGDGLWTCKQGSSPGLVTESHSCSSSPLPSSGRGPALGMRLANLCAGSPCAVWAHCRSSG